MGELVVRKIDGRKNNGGARPGAGRKSRAEVFRSAIQQANEKVTDVFPLIVDDMLRMARGQYSETKLKMEPAGHIFREDYQYDMVETKNGPRNFYRRVKVPMYPDLPPDQMVVTEHTETNFAPHVGAATYLMDRIMGKPQAISDEDLSVARADLVNQQIAANFYMWQAQYLKAQAEGKAIENEQWPKQFVSEEEVSQKIQVLAAELNKPLLHMTPEMWERFKASPNGLEEMKAHLGRSQASVYAAVMESDMDSEGKDEEESEDD